MSVITIARGTLTTSLKLSSYLSNELDYRVITREEVLEAASVYGIEESGLGEEAIIEQQPPSFWHRFSESRRLYLICFKAALMDFALKDNLIYIGHLAHLLFIGYPPVLRVRLAAPDDYRIQKLKEERGISEDKAVKFIKNIDDRRLKWSQFLYGVDWRDPRHYDLVLNPEKFSIEIAGKIIIASIKSPNFHPKPEHIELLKNIRLKAIVQVALMRSPRTKSLDLQIETDAKKGEVNIYGKTPRVGSETWERDIRETVLAIDEVTKLEVVPSITQIAE